MLPKRAFRLLLHLLVSHLVVDQPYRSIGTDMNSLHRYRNSTSIGIAIQESGLPREKLYITTKIATGLKDGQCRANFLAELARVEFALNLIGLCSVGGADGLDFASSSSTFPFCESSNPTSSKRRTSTFC